MVEVTRESRVRFRDLKPYYAPESLEALRGPYHGRIDLPHRARWQADRRGVNIDDPGGRRRRRLRIARGEAANRHHRERRCA